MTAEPVSRNELITARKAIITTIISGMPDDHRRFLLSFERSEPDWDHLGLEYIPDLPAIGWRQLNLDKLNEKARAQLEEKLECKLSA